MLYANITFYKNSIKSYAESKHNVNKPHTFMNFIWQLKEGKLQGAKLEKQQNEEP